MDRKLFINWIKFVFPALLLNLSCSVKVHDAPNDALAALYLLQAGSTGDTGWISLGGPIGIEVLSATGRSNSELSLFHSVSPSISYVNNSTSADIGVIGWNSNSWTTISPAPLQSGLSVQSSQATFDEDYDQTTGNTYTFFSSGGTTPFSTLKQWNSSVTDITPTAGITPTSSTPMADLGIYSGTLYIAYGDSVAGGVSALSYNGATWSQLGTSAEISSVQPKKVTALQTNSPTVAYALASSQGDRHVDLYMKTWNGTNWVNLGSSPFSTFLTDYDLFAQNNTIYLAQARPQSPSIIVQKVDPSTGQSQTYSSSGLEDLQPVAIAIGADGSGTPFIAVVDNRSVFGLFVRKWNGTNWENVGTPTSRGITDYLVYTNAGRLEIKVSPSGKPYVATVLNQEQTPLVFTTK